ncbi:MAG TPA: thioredoxin domain-containing protein [Thermoanaerobaculia bacterium]|nr:thioredoxin domain-containing protein [Thermoanaerobaculia bacterium]
MMIRTGTVLPWRVAISLLLASPSWAFAKGPKIAVGNDPSLKEGSPELVLVEISDFQCIVCARCAGEVMPQVYEKFIHTGKVELIYLDLPLHKDSFKAAEAAACAGDQGKFWEMHDRLFAHQDRLRPADLVEHARALDLDVTAFRKCLDSGRQAGGIREDMRVAQILGFTGTPAFVLGRRLPGSDKVQVLESFQGLPPYEELENKINALLASPKP